jgi:hypothetical protein
MDRYQQKLSAHEDVSASYAMLAADDFSSSLHAIIAAKTGFTVYVQRIEVAVTTDNAATQLFQDTAGTAVVVAGTKASPGIGPIEFDFGADGFACTESKGLSHKNSGAGMAASITVQAYRKRTATVSLNSASPVQPNPLP